MDETTWESALLSAAVVISLLFGRPSGCAAEEAGSSANYVMPGCRAMSSAILGKPNALSYDNEENFKAGLCSGEVAAVARFGKSTQAICMPETAQNGQLLVLVTREIDAEPARWNEGFLDLAMQALIKNFPCR